MEITFLKAVAMFVGTILFLIDINTVWNSLTYSGSARFWSDRLTGIQRTFYVGWGFFFGIICFLYVIYGKG